MDKKMKRSVQQLLVLLLCVAMLLPVMMPQPVQAEEGDSYTSGSITKVATGVNGITASGNLSSDQAIKVAEPTDSKKISFELVTKTDNLIQNGQYLIMSADGKYIMSHDARAESDSDWEKTDADAGSLAGGNTHAMSIELDADGGSLNTFFIGNDGKVYLDQSNRHFALWSLYQHDAVATHLSGVTIANGAALDDTQWYNFGTQQKLYEGVGLKKLTSAEAPYWYCGSYAIGADYNLRFLDFRVDSTPFRNWYRFDSLSDTREEKQKYVVEYIGDDTFVFYYKENANDFRFIYCDSNGKWTMQRYKNNPTGSQLPIAQAKTDVTNGKLKVRLYKYVPTSEYKRVALSGYKSYYAALNASTDNIKTAISKMVTVFDPDCKNLQVPYSANPLPGCYWVDTSAVKTSTTGAYKAYVKYRNDNASHTDTVVATVMVHIGQQEFTLNATTGYVSRNSLGKVYIGNNTSTTVKFKLNGVTTDVTVGMLKNADGTPFRPTEAKTYEGLTLHYNGWVITDDFDVVVSATTLDADNPTYPEPGSVKADKNGITSKEAFSQTGVAQIELSATAKPVDKGIDLIIMLDLSSSMRKYTKSEGYACGPKYEYDGVTRNTSQATKTDKEGNVTWDFEWVYNADWWQYTRMGHLEESLQKVIGDLRAENADVRIAMADFGDLDHYEFEHAVIDKNYREYPMFDRDGIGNVAYSLEMTNHLNFVLGSTDAGSNTRGAFSYSQPYSVEEHKYNEKNTRYSGNIEPKIYTGSGVVNADAFVPVSQLTDAVMYSKDAAGNESGIIEDLRRQNSRMLGTNYDVGLEYAYRLAYSRQQQNIVDGVDREIVVIFMSDGAAMQYNYFSGRGLSEAWSQYLIGETDSLVQSPYSWSYDAGVSKNPGVQQALEQMHKLLGEGKLLREANAQTGTGSNGYYTRCHCGSNGNADEFFAHINYYNDTAVTWYRFFRILAVNLNGNETEQQRLINIMKSPQDGQTYQTYSPYLYFYNKDGRNWWAEAIKGDTDKVYPVINRNAKEPDRTKWPSSYNGEFDLETAYDKFDGTTTNGLSLKGQDYISGFQGLGLPLYTIDFSMADDGKISATEANTVLDNVATSAGFHLSADSTETLTNAIKEIIAKSKLSASMAYYTDTMGADFDLSTTQTVTNDKGVAVEVNANPQIRALKYELDFTKPIKDSNDNIIGYERKKNTDGTYVYTVIESITFGGDKVAFSNLIDNGTTDIWNDTTGMIVGKYVQYNTNKYVNESNTGAVTISFGSQGNFSLPAETFFWSIGFLDEHEFVLEYQVYLDGSIENKLNLGRQDHLTNKQATLGYVDVLGNRASKSTVSPEYPWTEIRTDFSYYLVDANGNRVIFDKTGTNTGTGTNVSFADSIVYDATIWEETGDFSIGATKFQENIPAYLKLVNSGASVTVKFDETVTGQDGKLYNYWEITDAGKTTNVSTYTNNDHSNAATSLDTAVESANIYHTNVYYALTNAYNVGYNYYLVNSDGTPVKADGTTTTIAGSKKFGDDVTNPIWNADTQVNANADPSKYESHLFELYDPNATYTVHYSGEKNSSGKYDFWDITKSAGVSKNTTAVKVDGESTYQTTTNKDSATAPNKDTTVYFAVKPKYQVTYKYYLVNDDGQPILSNGTVTTIDQALVGTTGTQEIFANDTTIDASDNFTFGGNMYVLFDENADYTVHYGVDKNGSAYDHWDITSGVTTKTTKVKVGNGSTFDNTTDKNGASPLTSDTTVYFAVKLKNDVGYAFYLQNGAGQFVDQNGNVKNNAAESALTTPVYMPVGQSPTTLKADDHDNEVNNPLYELVDPNAEYSVYYGNESYWESTGNSTYVTTDNNSTFSNATTNKGSGNMPDSSLVYFAMKPKYQVTYKYYLVDDDGNPILEDGTSTTIDGAVVNQGSTLEIFNNSTKIDASDNFNSNGGKYVLFDETADYTVHYGVEKTGSTYAHWDITSGETTKTTQVKVGDSSTFDNTTDKNGANPLTSDTTVYFAVKLTKAKVANEDIVVIDFGIPVKINVLANDTDLPGSTLAGISKSENVPANGGATIESGFGTDEVDDQFGKISIDGGMVKYTPTTMKMDNADVFTYAALYNGKHYYAKVTVIPATTIYYEDNFKNEDGNNFIQFKAYKYIRGTDGADDITNKQGYEDYQWTTDPENAAASNATQHEDRPGVSGANIYGYDGAYTTMTQYSLDSAMKFTAHQIEQADGSFIRYYGTAEFTFTGTGFDLISLTSDTTGTITVQVTDGGKVVNKIVDTYYGYGYYDTNDDGKKEWAPTDGHTNAALYQIPVMKIENLSYGTHKVTITISYDKLFDHGQHATACQYDFFLDAIRIYDPANDGEGTGMNSEIKNSYDKDNEGWPEYFELRNLLIKAGTFNSSGNNTVSGIVYIDNTKAEGNPKYEVVDYKNYGPNNEVYLAPGQSIAFKMNATTFDGAGVEKIHLALKSVGGTASVKVHQLGSNTNVLNGENSYFNVDTATDLYYDITSLNNEFVIISNDINSGAILSVTNIKVTYDKNHAAVPDDSYFTVTSEEVANAIEEIQNNFANLGEEDSGEIINGTIDVKSASLSFEDEILTNLYFTTSNLNATEMGLLTWSTAPENGTIDNAENVYVGAEYDEVKGRYMVQTAGIAAKNLGDDIFMRVYAKTENGIVYSDVISYSPKQYALSRIEKSSSESMKALCAAMLNYGAAAQEYFGYKTDDLMNASLTAEQKALVKAYDATLFNGAVAADESKTVNFVKTNGFGKKTATVSFEGAFAINFYFTPNAEVASDMTFYYWTSDAEVMTAENAAGVINMVAAENGSYWADISGVAAKGLDDTFYAAAVYTDAQGNSCCTGVVAYSLSQYCMNNADGNMGSLAQATAMYGFYAAQYFCEEA